MSELKNPKLYHYLVTCETLCPLRMHAYVVTSRKRDIRGIVNYCVDQAERHHVPLLGIVLTTPLTTDVQLVQQILIDNDTTDAVKNTLAECTDFHLSLVLIEKDCPDDRQLMELH